ncbi:MAG: hypothetical protein V2B19_27035 [Pseudomonadota bacterium]
MKNLKVLLSGFIFFLPLFFSTAFCATLIDSTQVTGDDGEMTNGSMKNSFYFSVGGNCYIMADDISNNAISIYWSEHCNDDTTYEFKKRFRYSDIVPSGYRAWAPEVFHSFPGKPNRLLVFFSKVNMYSYTDPISTAQWNQILNNAKISYFWYDYTNGMDNGFIVGGIGGVQNVGISGGGNKGLIDSGVWRANNRWYMCAALHECYANGDVINWGSRLVWASSTSTYPTGGFSLPSPLLDHNSRRVDKVKYYMNGQAYDIQPGEISNVVEAPICSYWDHDGDGHQELYWSVGLSDPGCWQYSMVRRGNIYYNGIIPFIHVGDWWDDSFMDNYITPPSQLPGCHMLTHPDFTKNGELRATGWRNGHHVILNTDLYN